MQTNSLKISTVYSQNSCSGCVSAKKLLEEHGYHVQECNIMKNSAYKEELFKLLPGTRSVPQIFIGDEHIGGLTELQAYLKT